MGDNKDCETQHKGVAKSMGVGANWLLDNWTDLSAEKLIKSKGVENKLLPHTIG